MKDSIVFENAPVIEVVIGVQFEGAAISIQNIFDFYHKFKDEFAKIQVKEPLLSIIENMEGSNQVGLLPGHHSRFFFINETENKLIQLQPDRYYSIGVKAPQRKSILILRMFMRNLKGFLIILITDASLNI